MMYTAYIGTQSNSNHTAYAVLFADDIDADNNKYHIIADVEPVGKMHALAVSVFNAASTSHIYGNCRWLTVYYDAADEDEIEQIKSDRKLLDSFWFTIEFINIASDTRKNQGCVMAKQLAGLELCKHNFEFLKSHRRNDNVE